MLRCELTQVRKETCLLATFFEGRIFLQRDLLSGVLHFISNKQCKIRESALKAQLSNLYLALWLSHVPMTKWFCRELELRV